MEEYVIFCGIWSVFLPPSEYNPSLSFLHAAPLSTPVALFERSSNTEEVLNAKIQKLCWLTHSWAPSSSPNSYLLLFTLVMKMVVMVMAVWRWWWWWCCSWWWLRWEQLWMFCCWWKYWCWCLCLDTWVTYWTISRSWWAWLQSISLNVFTCQTKI